MANQQIVLNGFNMRIRDNGDGTYSTTNAKLVGEVQFQNALSITDTAVHSSATIDVSGYSGRKYLHVVHNLNQAITVTVVAYISNGTNGIVVGSKTLAANTSGIITAADIPALAEPVQQFAIQVQCSVAPASGTITILLEGVSA